MDVSTGRHTILYLCLFLVTILTVAARSLRFHTTPSGRLLANGKYDYKLKIACERTPLLIDCPNGHFINIIRAVYGRLDPTPCSSGLSHHGSAVSCTARRATSIVHNKCTGQKRCLFPVLNSVFHEDPCPGIYKYVEVYYSCTDYHRH